MVVCVVCRSQQSLEWDGRLDVCVYIYSSGIMYIYIYIHTYIHTYTHTHTYMYIYIYIHTHTHTYTHTYTHRSQQSLEWEGNQATLTVLVPGERGTEKNKG